MNDERKKRNILIIILALITACGYDGKFVVLYYNQESGEKSMLNTENPVTITVAE